MIDLHVHSNCSDGSEPPSSVIDLAAASGCSTVALTDHDGLGGLPTARTRAGEVGIGFIGGCEVSCTDVYGTVHLLVYFVPDDGPFDGFLSEAREDRERRNGELVDKLGWLGMPIDLDELAAEAGPGAVGRPHFAALLVRHGYARSITDAFGRYLAEGGAAYVPRAPLAPTTVIERARSVGAVVSLAHPLAIGIDRARLDRYVRTLVDIGLVGLESFYGSYDPEARTELVDLARRCGLVPTGGSDFHGTYKPDLSVGIGRGDLNVPDEIVDELSARRAPLA